MTTQYSTSLRLALIGDGDQAGTWGDTTNYNFGTLVEEALTGVVAISLTGLTTYTLKSYNGTYDDARSMVLIFAGSPTATVTITAPLVNKFYVVVNNTSQTITMSASGGSQSLNIPANVTAQCYCDASNVSGNGAGFYSAQTGSAGNFFVNGTLTASGESDTGNLSVGGNLSVTGTTALTGVATAPTPTTGDNSTKIATTAFTQTALASAAITGTINMWPTSSAPSGYLLCNGSAISRTTYAALFAIVGTTFGSGDGLTTFNLPNYADRMPIGVGSTAASVGATGGSAITTIVANNLPAHTHPVTDPGHNHTYAHAYNAAPQSGSSTPCFTSTYTDNTSTATTGITVGNNSTTNSAMNTISPYLGIYFIIKT